MWWHQSDTTGVAVLITVFLPQGSQTVCRANLPHRTRDVSGRVSCPLMTADHIAILGCVVQVFGSTSAVVPTNVEAAGNTIYNA